MIIKDPLYGFITINEPFQSIMENAHFQRLRNIKQLGQSSVVYSSANHTRFEHSLGTYYLAQKAAENNNIENKNEFIAAALMHDIGHYPFSHAIEGTIKEINGMGHEKQSIDIIKNSDICGIIEKAGMDVQLICDYIEGKGNYAGLIAGAIDVDRLDYLRRDSYYTGVAYGVIESDVIINNYCVKGNDYIADIKYLPALESVLISRYFMRTMVYTHHRTIIANAMLRSALLEAVNGGEFSIDDLIRFDDIDLISRLRSSKTCAKQMMKNISARSLYKEAVLFYKNDFDDISKIAGLKQIPDIEKSIAKKLSLRNSEILISVLDFPKENKSRILINPSMKKLEDISPIVRSIIDAEWNHWFVGVYTTEENIEKVQKEKDMIKSYLVGN